MEEHLIVEGASPRPPTFLREDYAY